jgi:hypothetical protein
MEYTLKPCPLSRATTLTEGEIDSLREIIQYMWKDEYRDFLETFDLETPWSDETYVDWRKVCESSENFRNHMFYHLLVLKSTLEKNTEVQC